MVISILLSAWIACYPAPNWPTPCLSWDQSYLIPVEGHHVYWRNPGETWPLWNLAADLPCWYEYDDNEVIIAKHCWGHYGPYTTLVYPMQRATDEETVIIEWMVRAYNDMGESTDSPIVEFCMPHIWHPGEPYE